MKKIKILLSLSEEAVAELHQRKTRTRRSQSQVVEDLLLASYDFPPELDAAISREATERGASRMDVIAEVVQRALSAESKEKTSRSGKRH